MQSFSFSKLIALNMYIQITSVLLVPFVQKYIEIHKIDENNIINQENKSTCIVL